MSSASRIKNKARELGFEACGITAAHKLEEHEAHLQQWLDNGYEASMNWMHNYFEERLDPTKLVPGAKSVIVVLLNYFPNEKQNNEAPQISKYAYGKDYHDVVKEKLKLLYQFINKEIQPINGRIFVDSAPVMERAWAQQAGLGWVGKNSLLINNNMGSFFFIGELIIDLELDYDRTFPADFCGSCTKCIDSCPTGAIVENKVIDSNKCISYWTIEHKGEINYKQPEHFQNRIFGCDICQDVCPWNRKAKPHQVDEFKPHPNLLHFTQDDWQSITGEEYREIFRKSAVKRTKFSGLKRNIEFVSKA